jgi:hypothetical protein
MQDIRGYPSNQGRASKVEHWWEADAVATSQAISETIRPQSLELFRQNQLVELVIFRGLPGKMPRGWSRPGTPTLCVLPASVLVTRVPSPQKVG